MVVIQRRTWASHVPILRDGPSGVRNTTTSVEIEVTLDTVPQCTIQALPVPKANPSEKLTLQGLVGPDALALEYEWTLSSGSLQGGTIDTLAATPLLGSVSPKCDASGCTNATPPTTVNFVLAAGSVTPGGVYSFFCRRGMTSSARPRATPSSTSSSTQRPRLGCS